MPGAMPQNHARALREQGPLSRRAKQGWGLGALVVIAATLAIILFTSGTPNRPGCIDTYLPGVIGAQTFDECGGTARQTCSTIRGNQHEYGTVGVLIIAKACRAHGFPVG